MLAVDACIVISVACRRGERFGLWTENARDKEEQEVEEECPELRERGKEPLDERKETDVEEPGVDRLGAADGDITFFS